jgi:succinate-acetate transporter protein
MPAVPTLTILRAEGAVLLIAAVTAYGWAGQSWWLFAILFLAPDLGIAAYLAGPRLGALGYNLVHTTVLPLALAIAGLAWQAPLAVALACIWLAHIGFDRALGYGLKEPTGFKDTHLGGIGG